MGIYGNINKIIIMKTKKKKIKKLKRELSYLTENVESLRSDVDVLFSKRKKSKQGTMKFMRLIITISIVVIALLGLYKTFF